MTAEQIKVYEYCKGYSVRLERYKGNLPFSSQVYGCGTQSPAIEHALENIHEEMYTAVFNAIHSATEKVDKIIEEL
jgi:hypothetical protein